MKINEPKFKTICHKQKLEVHPITLDEYAENVSNGDFIYMFHYPTSIEKLATTISDCVVDGKYVCNFYT